MKKHIVMLLMLVVMMFMATNCDTWVEGIEPLIDAVEDARMSNEEQVEFLINGVLAQYTYCLDNLLVFADILADQYIFDSAVPGASYPQMSETDRGAIQRDNTSITGIQNSLGRVRFFADDLLRRADEMTYSAGNEGLEDDLRFYGNLFGGIARYLYATYIGLHENQGGGIIDAGPFINSPEMYGLAIDKFTLALTFTADAWWTRVVHSLMARAYLYNGDAANAAAQAAQGLVDGDADFTAEYMSENSNYYWQQGGLARTQVVIDPRYNDFILADPAEAARIPLQPLEVDLDAGLLVFYIQVKYATNSAPIPFMTWRENELMLAETDLAGTGLARINAVRGAWGIAPLADLGADATVTLLVERDKELFLTGARLPDQRRYDAQYGLWHLDADAWRYLPVVEDESAINENIDF